MNEAGLVVIIVLLFYIIYEIKNSQEKKERQEKSGCPFPKVLPEFLGKTCEIVNISGINEFSDTIEK